ncbi:MAG TPA: zinc ribbon domain-containing protein [Gammaproteobacteria bacterium]|nr:zinc ribbon domain-containing protein [Gammaproteobacteria bacterium]
MPIYEYICDGCGHELEALQAISDAPLTECPQCGRPQLRKRVSAAAFRLKGGGWYETDFKSRNKRNIASDGSGGGSEGGKSPDGAKSGEGSKSKESGTAKTASGGGGKDTA